jgi:hypothetical protein
MLHREEAANLASTSLQVARITDRSSFFQGLRNTMPVLESGNEYQMLRLCDAVAETEAWCTAS